MKKLLSNDHDSQRCPDCDEPLTADVMNIKEGVALCPRCGKLSRLSELNTSGRSAAEILEQPPTGCALATFGQTVIATVSLRSLTGFLFPAGFALFWNAIVSVFVLIAIAGLYANLIGPLPAWFPAPGLNDGKPEMNGGPMELGMTLFLCVFLIPFVLVGILMTAIAIVNIVGKVEVVIDEFNSYVATGFGFVLWKRRFDPRQVRSIELGTTAWKTENGTNPLIVLTADKTIKFGSLLQSERMDWLRIVLKELLLPPNVGGVRQRPSSLTWAPRK